MFIVKLYLFFMFTLQLDVYSPSYPSNKFFIYPTYDQLF